MKSIKDYHAGLTFKLGLNTSTRQIIAELTQS